MQFLFWTQCQILHWNIYGSKNCMSHHCTLVLGRGLDHTFDILFCILMFLNCTVIWKAGCLYLGLSIVP